MIPVYITKLMFLQKYFLFLNLIFVGFDGYQRTNVFLKKPNINTISLCFEIFQTFLEVVSLLLIVGNLINLTEIPRVITLFFPFKFWLQILEEKKIFRLKNWKLSTFHLFTNNSNVYRHHNNYKQFTLPYLSADVCKFCITAISFK